MNFVKRNSCWRQIRKGWSSNWKLWPFHQLGLCQAIQLHIMLGQTRCQFFPAMVLSQCGNTCLQLPAIHLMIMSSGPLLHNYLILILDALFYCHSPFLLPVDVYIWLLFQYAWHLNSTISEYMAALAKCAVWWPLFFKFNHLSWLYAFSAHKILQSLAIYFLGVHLQFYFFANLEMFESI